MWKFDWTLALRRAAAGGVLLSCLGGGLAAYAQAVKDHPSDTPPAPADASDPAPEKKDEPTSKDEGKADEKKEEEKKEEEEKAEEAPACDGLQRLFDDSCGNNWLDDKGLKLHGWVAQSFTWNPENPDTRTNGPVTFTDRANEYQLNQLYLVFERVLDQSKEELQFGGRADMMFGSDYFFTTARGWELEQNGTHRWNSQDGPNRTFLGPNQGRLHGFAMPQLYAEMAGYNASIKFGHFYTIIGNEVVTAPQNFFVTHAYTMQYGEPFTHTGMLGSYKLSDSLTLTSGIVQGWDNFDDTNGSKSYLGGLTWTNADSGTTVAFGIINGHERLDFSNVSNRRGQRNMYSVVLTQALTDKWTWVVQHDRGAQQNAVANAGGTFDKAEWYGVNNYLFYQINDKLKAGCRYEWFRDDDGFRILGDAQGANYHELSFGLNWTMFDCVMLRPECRWDWVDKKGNRPFDLSDNPAGVPPIGKDGSQFLLSTDLVITF